MISALVMGIGTVLAFRMKGQNKADKSKSQFYFRKKYTKFYFLEVFYGARKQIFFTFGPYVMILFYKASTSIICLPDGSGRVLALKLCLLFLKISAKLYD